MVRIEDARLEEEVISTGYHIALPFELNYYENDGRIDIVVYSFCADIAREFEQKFHADPFTNAARSFIYEKISPIMQGLGYDCADAVGRMHFAYRACGDISTEGMYECDVISSLEGENFGELPLGEFELDPDDPCDRMAVVRQDGKIVCYAGLNDVSESNGCYEITVECEAQYRRRGYAKSCVAHLAKHIISCGECAEYICTDENIASQNTARAAGFKLYKKCLPFVCYKNTEEVDEEEIF